MSDKPFSRITKQEYVLQLLVSGSHSLAQICTLADISLETFRTFKSRYTKEGYSVYEIDGIMAAKKGIGGERAAARAKAAQSSGRIGKMKAKLEKKILQREILDVEIAALKKAVQSAQALADSVAGVAPVEATGESEAGNFSIIGDGDDDIAELS